MWRLIGSLLLLVVGIIFWGLELAHTFYLYPGWCMMLGTILILLGIGYTIAACLRLRRRK